MNDKEWLNFQIEFLKIDKYFTKTAQEILGEEKSRYLKELEMAESKL